jgi:pimeloyl-ACP methyl ester carboxylesterase
MRNTQRITKAIRHPVLSAVVLAAMLAGSAAVTLGQENEDQAGPLVLKKQGSFFVGGETVFSDALIGAQPLPGVITFPTSGNIVVNQMYVHYMIPEGGDHVPVVMVHGGTLSGKSWETTPDGRMGWDEYFVRQGHAVYVPDQVSRARSGFNQTKFNEVLQGIAPPSALPNILRLSRESAWTLFRFGPTFGVPYPDTQFPVEAADEFAKQGIPDLNFATGLLPTPNPTITNMAALARKLGGVILMGHSESSLYPTQAALIDPTGVRGIIGLELGCLAPLTADQLASLKKIPILIMVGDRFGPTPQCVQEMAQINGAGGDMTFIALPDVGLHGNSHMFMLDKNNLQVADVILAWIDKHVEETKEGPH